MRLGFGFGIFTHIHNIFIIQVDKEHERYFEKLEEIDPGFTSCITHFIILDTPR